MSTLLWVLLILALVLGVCSLLLIVITNRNKRLHTEAAFSECDAKPSVQLQDLWIDPEKKKWAIAKESADITVYGFSEIDKVELVQDGETYVQKDGVLKTQLGGLVFGALSAVTSGGEPRKVKMTGNIYIHIFVRQCPFPLESIVLIGSPVKSNSKEFKNKVLLAEKLMHTLNSMKDGTYTGAEQEK